MKTLLNKAARLLTLAAILTIANSASIYAANESSNIGGILFFDNVNPIYKTLSNPNQNTEISDLYLKLLIAERIAGNANAPQESIESLFEGIIQAIEEDQTIHLDPSLVEMIWNAVSVERIKVLKETLMLEFCRKILTGFNTDELEEILDEHIKTGIIHNPSYAYPIKSAYSSERDSILNTVIAKADSMKDELAKDVIQILKNNGVRFF